MRLWALGSILLSCVSACTAPEPVVGPVAEWQAPQVEKAEPIASGPWQEVVVSVRSIERTAPFFTNVAGYEVRAEGNVDTSELTYWGLPEGASGRELVLGRTGYDQGRVRLVEFANAGQGEPMRPGSRPWDTGCFFSLMVRAKELRARYEEALALGWWTETPIADLEFGASKLQIIIFKGPDGLQVQAYERLEPDLPEAIGPFERMTQPFNLMQTVPDRDAARDLMVGALGFETFFFGPPHVDAEPTFMPLGIPFNLTTSVSYGAGIYSAEQPVGQFGRLETIEIMGLDGRDHSPRCIAPNFGILSVRFPVDDIDQVGEALGTRNVPITRPIQTARLGDLGQAQLLGITTPDGAMIDFYQPEEN